MYRRLLTGAGGVHETRVNRWAFAATVNPRGIELGPVRTESMVGTTSVPFAGRALTQLTLEGGSHRVYGTGSNSSGCALTHA